LRCISPASERHGPANQTWHRAKPMGSHPQRCMSHKNQLRNKTRAARHVEASAQEEAVTHIKRSFGTSQLIKSRRMRWAGYVARMGENRNAYRLLVGKPLGRPRRKWVDNIRMEIHTHTHIYIYLFIYMIQTRVHNIIYGYIQYILTCTHIYIYECVCCT
jgi:hypothetical protein